MISEITNSERPKMVMELISIPDAAEGIHRGQALTVEMGPSFGDIERHSVVVKSRYKLRDGSVRIRLDEALKYA